MAVRFTFGCCPGDAQAQEGCGVPWGATITPFAAVDETGSTPAFGKHAQLVPRCESCWAYINALCEMEQWAWTCALCGNLNALSASAAARYAPPHSCPELTSSFVDLELDGYQVESFPQANTCNYSFASPYVGRCAQMLSLWTTKGVYTENVYVGHGSLLHRIK